VKRLALKLGEVYAIKPSAIERDADGFFIVTGDDPTPNTEHGSVVVVHIRGALSQFDGEGGDSYESIVQRVEEAIEKKPTAVVLCISSPGGLVAGLNECVFKLQRMRIASGIPLIAQVNELAASAAFALCCACDRRFAPPSAIVGSVGCISTIVSQLARDKAEGIEFRIITSGSRKSDGHPHVEISDAAVKAETLRNAQLAEQFFELAGKALRLPPRRLKGYQAAIFLGDAARQAGLINAVRSLDETIAGLDRSDVAAPTPAPNSGNVTDRRAKEVDTPVPAGTSLAQNGQSGAVAQSGTNQRGKHAGQLEGLDREDRGRARERNRPGPTPRP
jgi:capsid assembly protease